MVLMNDFGYSCFLVCASSFPVELLLAANAALNGLHPGKNSRVFFLYSLQGAGIESQRFQDCGSDLRGFNRAGDYLGPEVGVRQQKHHVGVVAVETAVFH